MPQASITMHRIFLVLACADGIVREHHNNPYSLIRVTPLRGARWCSKAITSSPTFQDIPGSPSDPVALATSS